MKCDWSDKIHALYDGALEDAARDAAEAHANACPACASQLAAVRGMGRFLNAGAPPVPTIFELSALRARLKSARLARMIEPRVIRLAQWLTSAAAAVMLVSGLALAKMPAPSAPATVTAQKSSTQNWTAFAIGASEDQISAGDPLSPTYFDVREEAHE